MEGTGSVGSLGFEIDESSHLLLIKYMINPSNLRILYLDYLTINCGLIVYVI